MNQQAEGQRFPVEGDLSFLALGRTKPAEAKPITEGAADWNKAPPPL
ncbi:MULTISPECIES: hypothetical protein [Paenibacillus]|nr:hypothetical protein [Paenibacillus caseinilyticus]MCZ8522615.1 hypothetical protein [Paenibacillus caseinilyticus]